MMSKVRHPPKPRIAALLAFCIVVSLFIGLEYLERQRYLSLHTRTINRLSRLSIMDREFHLTTLNIFLNRSMLKTTGLSRTGLGFTVVWNTVYDHRGRLTVESCEKYIPGGIVLDRQYAV
ncbi:MAG: hypothetical protein Q8R88_01560 [Desulfoprunum sp.]|nr:hypothetical protein [Desulfoprunum sp.]